MKEVLKMKELFESVKLKNGMVIKNRFAKSAMSEAMGDSNFQPGKNIPSLYRLWAEGGTGLIMTGNVMVDKNQLGEPGNIVFDRNSDMEKLEKWAEEGQKNGAKLFVQINHPGKQSPSVINKQPVAPSAIAVEGEMAPFFNPPRELTIEEIKDITEKFGEAAEISKKAGFSGVQIHAAHGYLVAQFLSPADNKREDEYGGSIENRMRFLKEIYLKMREKTGDDFPIGMKINSTDFTEGGFSEEDSIYVVKEMDKLGMDFIEVSGGNYESPKMFGGDEDKVYFAGYAKKIKEFIEAPIMVTGGIKTIDSMEEIIDSGTADFIGLARSLALEPFIPNQIENGSYRTADVKRLTTGIKSLDKKAGSFLGLAYSQMLMHKLGSGRKAAPLSSAWPVIFYTLVHRGLSAFAPQRV